jgi:hypothetical protein
VALILSIDIYANVSIEIHMKYDKLLILRKKSDRCAYLNLCKT